MWYCTLKYFDFFIEDILTKVNTDPPFYVVIGKTKKKGDQDKKIETYVL